MQPFLRSYFVCKFHNHDDLKLSSPTNSIRLFPQSSALQCMALTGTSLNAVRMPHSLSCSDSRKVRHSSFRFCFVDRKRGLVCRLMTSETSPAQYDPHRLIITNYEKSLFINNSQRFVAGMHARILYLINNIDKYC